MMHMLPTASVRQLVGLAALAVALASPGALAQPVLGRAEAMSTNARSAFYHVRPGTASVQVQVLGAAHTPGLYEISEGTGLSALLALAGGPALGTTPAGTRDRAVVRLYRSGTEDHVAFEAPLEQIAGDATTPVLQDGDVLLVEVTGGQIESASTNASAFYYIRPETASVQVQVLGAAHKPGLYEVSEGTDLGALLALAGGPALGTTSAGTRTEALVRLYRPGAAGPELLYEGPFEPNVMPPAVRDGDVLVVEVISHRRFSWRDVIQVVSAVGVIALAVDRLTGSN